MMEIRELFRKKDPAGGGTVRKPPSTLRKYLTLVYISALLVIGPLTIVKWYSFFGAGPRYTLYDGIYQCELSRRNSMLIIESHKKAVDALSSVLELIKLHENFQMKDSPDKKEFYDAMNSTSKNIHLLHELVDKTEPIDCSYLHGRVPSENKDVIESFKKGVSPVSIIDSLSK